MKHDHIGERDRAAKRADVMRTAEYVLREIYRSATGPEILENQRRLRELVHREATRRSRRHLRTTKNDT